MSHIVKLDKNLAELIAAGEVVERPASVVKELLENAIDAKCDCVTVEIKNGGTSYIRISDTGSGISRQDVPIAFLRNATSKIKNQDDLEKISTLGFRGEALASICAMAKVEMITRTKDEMAGTHYIIEGSEEKSIEDTGCPQGTTIIVRDLFYNTPARMKFLKKDVAEGTAVGGVIDKIALSHPEISIKFIRDGKVILHTPGDKKLKSVIYCIYGKEITKNMLEVDYTLNGVKITGFIGKPSECRPSKAMQIFYLNGRFIKTNTGMAALSEAYKNFIMVGKFPICVLNIQMEYSLVDVNVHPAKIEVRFYNERPVFDAIYHATLSALENDTKQILNETVGKSPQLNTDIAKKIEPQPIQMKFKPSQSTQPVKEYKFQTLPKDTEIDFSKINEIPSKMVLNDVSIDPQNIDVKCRINKIESIHTSKKDTIKSQKIPIDDIVENEPKNEIHFNFKCEIFDTYIMLESSENKLILIDKHAAHERLIYEKLKSQQTKDYAQSLLQPIDITLSPQEYTAIIDNKELLTESGFEIDEFGVNTIIVRSCPQYIENKSIKDEIIEIATYLVENNRDISTKYKDWIYHNIACRSAIKGGNKTDTKEIIELVKMLYNNPSVQYCPHGRPIFSEISKYDLEKKFGRV